MAMKSGKIGRVAVALLLLSVPVFAGEVYKFSDEQTGGLQNSTRKGEILVDSSKYRIEYDKNEDDDPRQPRLVISKDGGEHAFALNLEKRTYYALDQAPLDQPTSPLFALVPISPGVPGWDAKSTVGEVTVTMDESPDTLGKLQTRHYAIALGYDLKVEIQVTPPPGAGLKASSETIQGRVKMAADFWTLEDKARPPVDFFQTEIRTGHPEVDARLAEKLAALRGLVIKKQLTISTAGDRGLTGQTETLTSLVEGPQPVKTEPALFEVPAGFKVHRPEVTVPRFESGPPPG
jgi:hypothetical protein